MALGPTENQVQVAYHDGLRLLLQQETSRIWQYCEQFNVDAEQGLSFDEIAPFEDPLPFVPGSDYQPITVSELQFTRRWLQTASWKFTKHWPYFSDTVRLTDPTSSVMRQIAMTYNRRKDSVAVAAMFAAVKRGKTLPGDDTDVTFPAGQVIAVDVVNSGTPAATGLNRAKLNAVFALFVQKEAIMDDGPGNGLHMAITAKQLKDMLNDDKVTDRDSLLGQFERTGRLNYLNIDFHNYQGLPVDGNSYRRCPVWMPMGMRVGVTRELTTDLSQRKDWEGLPWQAHAHAQFGAARAEEKMIAEVKCSEA
ncbi:MAG: hypothetical protein IPK79_00945 [Vampirovibrionales bacterium]|nr:hypothetical protein [Vampirovibrionales bacterium]